MSNELSVRMQLQERGSLSPLRGYRPENQVDIFLENCGTCFLVQARTSAGHELIRRALANSTLLSFGNEIVLNYRVASSLLKRGKELNVKIKIVNYASEIQC